MDFDIVLYIVIIVGGIVWSAVKNLKKDEKERTAKKNAHRPITVETADGTGSPDVTAPREKKSGKKHGEARRSPESEYFSYETMGDRDFQQEFEQSVGTVTGTEESEPAARIAVNEESVFNGVVWSEILRRKY